MRRRVGRRHRILWLVLGGAGSAQDVG